MSCCQLVPTGTLRLLYSVPDSLESINDVFDCKITRESKRQTVSRLVRQILHTVKHTSMYNTGAFHMVFGKLFHLSSGLSLIIQRRSDWFNLQSLFGGIPTHDATGVLIVGNVNIQTTVEVILKFVITSMFWTINVNWQLMPRRSYKPMSNCNVKSTGFKVAENMGMNIFQINGVDPKLLRVHLGYRSLGVKNPGQL